MKKRWAIYRPDDGWYFQPSRKVALEQAHRALSNMDGGDGWSDDMTSLGVYFGWGKSDENESDIDWKPLVTAREKFGSKRWKRDCPGSEDNHDDCQECEGSGFVDQHGDPWFGDPDWQYIVEYELPPLKSFIQRVLSRLQPGA